MKKHLQHTHSSLLASSSPAPSPSPSPATSTSTSTSAGRGMNTKYSSSSCVDPRRPKPVADPPVTKPILNSNEKQHPSPSPSTSLVLMKDTLPTNIKKRELPDPVVTQQTPAVVKETPPRSKERGVKKSPKDNETAQDVLKKPAIKKKKLSPQKQNEVANGDEEDGIMFVENWLDTLSDKLKANELFQKVAFNIGSAVQKYNNEMDSKSSTLSSRGSSRSNKQLNLAKLEFKTGIDIMFSDCSRIVDYFSDEEIYQSDVYLSKNNADRWGDSIVNNAEGELYSLQWWGICPSESLLIEVDKAKLRKQKQLEYDRLSSIDDFTNDYPWKDENDFITASAELKKLMVFQDYVNECHRLNVACCYDQQYYLDIRGNVSTEPPKFESSGATDTMTIIDTKLDIRERSLSESENSNLHISHTLDQMIPTVSNIEVSNGESIYVNAIDNAGPSHERLDCEVEHQAKVPLVDPLLPVPLVEQEKDEIIDTHTSFEKPSQQENTSIRNYTNNSQIINDEKEMGEICDEVYTTSLNNSERTVETILGNEQTKFQSGSENSPANVKNEMSNPQLLRNNNNNVSRGRGVSRTANDPRKRINEYLLSGTRRPSPNQTSPYQPQQQKPSPTPPLPPQQQSHVQNLNQSRPLPLGVTNEVATRFNDPLQTSRNNGRGGHGRSSFHGRGRGGLIHHKQ